MYLGNRGRQGVKQQTLSPQKNPQTINQTKYQPKKPPPNQKAQNCLHRKDRISSKRFWIYFLVTPNYLCPAANAILNTEPTWCWSITDHNNKLNQPCSMKVSKKETDFYLQSNCFQLISFRIRFQLMTTSEIDTSLPTPFTVTYSICQTS